MELKIKATKRKVLGRKVKIIRKEGLLPANIYGKKVKSESISVDLKEFRSVFKEAGETNIVNVLLDGKKRPTLVHNIQVNPITDVPLHVDFFQVDLRQKVTAKIPVELVGDSPAEKQGLGTIVQYTDEVEVEALPTELPEAFEIDTSKLEKVEDQILVKDIILDKSKVAMKEEEDKVIVKVEPLRKEEEVELPVEEEGEIGEGEEVTEEAEGEGEKGKEEAEDKEASKS